MLKITINDPHTHTENIITVDDSHVGISKAHMRYVLYTHTTEDSYRHIISPRINIVEHKPTNTVWIDFLEDMQFTVENV